jgi:hypothetical protein
MNRNRHALTLAVAIFVTGCAATPFTSAAASARADAPVARQSEPRRRPGGPATGPAITLPRGQGEGLEQPPPDGPKGTSPSARRWEYCAITHTVRRQPGFGSSPATYFAVVRYYPNAGEEVEGRDEDDALANALSKLGEEGWELVAVRQNLNLLDGSGRATHSYLFKRPK